MQPLLLGLPDFVAIHVLEKLTFNQKWQGKDRLLKPSYYCRYRQYVSFSNTFLTPLSLPPKPSASAWLAFCFGRAHAAGAFMRGIGGG